MSTALGPDARIIQPDGLSLAILTISCVFLGLSIITVSLRTYTRAAKGTFGLDDAFILAGCVAYTAASGLSIYSLLVGLGRLEKTLNPWQWSKALEYYIFWILTYVLALATVKSSICITIMRIASMKMNLRVTVYILLAVTWASFFVTFVGTLLYCRPVNTIWTPQLIVSGNGTCAPVDTFVIIGHVSTVTTIATDLALVVVPAIILWNTQMKRQAKLQAFGLLSFASIASVITMIRIPYVNRFKDGKDLQFWVAHIMLCSNIETGIGCIASSVPSLRHFFRRENTESGSGGPSNDKKSSNPNFFTVGSEPRERRLGNSFRNPTDLGFSLSSIHHGRAEESWERLRDGESEHSDTPIDSRRVIQKEQTYAVNIEMKNTEMGRRRGG